MNSERPPEKPARKTFPLLKNLTCMEEDGVIRQRLERRYRRLCAVQRELGRLDFGKAKPGDVLEDLVFEAADFNACRRVSAGDFRLFFEAGPEDFSDAFFTRAFGMDRAGIRGLIRKSFERTGDVFCYREGNPFVQALLFSVLRTLQMSLDWLPLAGREELAAELKEAFPGLAENAGEACKALILNLDNTLVTQEDGTETRLFIAPPGGLSGTFRPGGKPWTLTLIPPGEFQAG